MKFLLVFMIVLFLLALYMIRVDNGFDDIQCGPNAQGGRSCVYE